MVGMVCYNRWRQELLHAPFSYLAMALALALTLNLTVNLTLTLQIPEAPQLAHVLHWGHPALLSVRGDAHALRVLRMHPLSTMGDAHALRVLHIHPLSTAGDRSRLTQRAQSRLSIALGWPYRGVGWDGHIEGLQGQCRSS